MIARTGSERLHVSSLLERKKKERRETKGRELTWLRETACQFSAEPRKEEERAIYKSVTGQVSIGDTL